MIYIIAAIIIIIYATILYYNLTMIEIPEEEYDDLSDDEFNDKYKWHFLGPIIGIVLISLAIIVYTILVAGL